MAATRCKRHQRVMPLAAHWGFGPLNAGRLGTGPGAVGLPNGAAGPRMQMRDIKKLGGQRAAADPSSSVGRGGLDEAGGVAGGRVFCVFWMA